MQETVSGRSIEVSAYHYRRPITESGSILDVLIKDSFRRILGILTSCSLSGLLAEDLPAAFESDDADQNRSKRALSFEGLQEARFGHQGY